MNLQREINLSGKCSESNLLNENYTILHLAPQN